MQQVDIVDNMLTAGKLQKHATFCHKNTQLVDVAKFLTCATSCLSGQALTLIEFVEHLCQEEVLRSVVSVCLFVGTFVKIRPPAAKAGGTGGRAARLTMA